MSIYWFNGYIDDYGSYDPKYDMDIVPYYPNRANAPNNVLWLNIHIFIGTYYDFMAQIS